MNARFFTAMSLLLLGTPVYADEPVPTEESGAVPLALDGRWSAQVEGGKLIVALTVVNTGATDAPVVVMKDLALGPTVSVTALAADGERGVLEASRTKAPTRAQREAAPPSPTIAVLPANGDVAIGAYSFKFPHKYHGQAVQLQAVVEVGGQPVTITHDMAATEL